jgi:hypothetical protein
MTDSTKPEASAVVTREHRIAALTAFGQGAVVGTQNAVADWVEDPTREHGLFSDTLPTLAQAIADAEARGRASRDEEVERLRRELADWGLIRDEPVVIGRLAVIKAAKPKRMVSVGRFPITPVEATDSRLAECSRCHDYVPKTDGLCHKCIQSGPEYPAGLDRRGLTDVVGQPLVEPIPRGNECVGEALGHTITDEQLAKDIAVLRRYYPTGNAASESLARITAALAGRGVR